MGRTPSAERPFARLSPAARSAWAKHDRASDEWLPLWRHMADSGAVAGQLWDAWVPRGVREFVAEELPSGVEDARRLVVFLAASHDTGKATPAFACQVEALADRMRAHGLDMPSAKEFGQDRRLAPHGLAGQEVMLAWLSKRYGLGGRTAGQFAVVAGGHHGVPPTHQQMHDVRLRSRLLRHTGPSEERWREVQEELLDACAELAGVTERLPEWRDVRLPQPVQVLLTALVIMADWIASASELFPYDPASWRDDPTAAEPDGEKRRLRAAWTGLDLPGPWAPEEPARSAEELFAGRFALPEGAVVRPVQAEAVRVAWEMDPAGLLMIEAPMGEGKTEAAFAAAEVLAARTGAGGLLVALPTRATGDAMFPRLLRWLERLPSDGPRSVVLAHAKAALNDLWAGMMRTGRRAIDAVDQDGPERAAGRGTPAERDGTPAEPAAFHAHQWLRGRKKALLASFAVGTVDQVLFAGLKSRHLALRHLAVAGKVVVVDEVHAYDAYMNRYLDRVLEWLAAYRVPVVLLSATLPAARRRALAAAYAGVDRPLSDGDAYPLVTAVAPGAPVRTARPAAASGRRTEVAVERIDDGLATLVDRLASELRNGGCALVVRNTVQRVLEAADAVRERFGADAVTVAHSLFLAADRSARDETLREVFGPDGNRPDGPHIVIASQVVEQSLDVDFDLLVTDLAPVDLMLQRVGRLHRHPRRRPEPLARARCLVSGVDWTAPLPEPVRGSEVVYGKHTLLRTLAVLAPHLDGAPVVLPDDISPLVQAVYGEDQVGPEDWEVRLEAARTEHLRTLAEKRAAAEGFLLGPVRRAGRPLYGWLDAHAGDADDSRAGRAQVRDTKESLEVLVVQRRGDGRLTTVPWLSGGRGGLDLPTDFPPDRRAAEAVAASAITLPGKLCHPGIIDRTISHLERFLVPAWQVKECPWLAGELLMVLDEHCQTRLSGFLLKYSVADGLRVLTDTRPDGGGSRKEDDGGGAGGTGTRASGADAARGLTTGGGGGMPMMTEKQREPDDGSFDLVTRPWVPVQLLDGTLRELSLRDVFLRAHEVRRLAGDLPTQDFALVRLLLAVLYDALRGPGAEGEPAPATLEDWSQLWRAGAPFAGVPAYLDAHRARFDLLHPREPFFQVAGLRTEKDEVSSLNRIVADVPNGDPFFAMRRPGVERLSYAEAARWLVHAHAYDPSGIKSGMAKDPRAKAGKVYPLGVGSAGGLGGVFAEGATLRETLLLNLVPLDEGIAEGASSPEDAPAWRRPRQGPGEREAGPRPRGLCDLYTWQSRRVLLRAGGGAVTGVVLGYGDPLALESPWTLEPLSGWRRSPAQEKKQGRPLVYMPRQHDPSRAAWRGLASLLPARGDHAPTGHGDPPSRMPAGVVRWLAMLATEEELDVVSLIRVRLVGAVYGTQQSVVDEVVDDSVVMPVVLLHAEDAAYGTAAVDAVADAEAAVQALGHLAGNLALAAGSRAEPAAAGARDLGFGALDVPYRQWLRALADQPDPQEARRRWQVTVRRSLTGLAKGLLDSAGPAASEGRVVDLPGHGKRWVDDARADLWFRRRLNQLLARETPADPPGPPEAGHTGSPPGSLPPAPSVPDHVEGQEAAV